MLLKWRLRGRYRNTLHCLQTSSFNQLPLIHLNKCKVVSYGRNIDCNYSYHINDVPLEQLDSIKDLGVIFDSQFKFDKHIADKINKAYAFLGLIKRNFTYLCKDAFITLYKSLVRSHLEYAVQVWSPYTVAYIKKLKKFKCEQLNK